MFSTVAAALIVVVAIAAGLAMVHLSGIAPLLVTCAAIMIVIGLSIRQRS